MDFFSNNLFKDGQMVGRSIFFCFLFVFLSSAHSFEITGDFKDGYFWQRFPIKLTVLNQDGRFEATESATLSALEIWESSLNYQVDVWEYVPVEEEPQLRNVVRWSERFEQETGYSSNTLAVTVRNLRAPYIRMTEIILNSNHPLLSDENFLAQVILHELGHTIGLGHSKDPYSIMYATLSPGGSTPSYISYDDEEGMKFVVNKNLSRQKNGSTIKSEENQSSNSGIPSCGTIDWNDKSGSNNIISSMLGILMFAAARKLYRLKNP
jgi:hypothetical protein